MACQLIIRAADGVRRWENIDDWTVLVMLASMSADPETFAELDAAVRRYQPHHTLIEDGVELAELPDGVPEEGCLVDIVGHTTVAGDSFEMPENGQSYAPHDDQPAVGFPAVWFDLPEDWVFSTDQPDWRKLVDERARKRSEQPRIDVRMVLFGRPMLDFLAQRVLTEAASGVPQDAKAEYQKTREIHAEWMMTPREDLAGGVPRQLLLADRERIQSDLEHRSYQWTMQGHEPPGLPEDSFAYRFGGFGTAEIVLYFEMIRAVLAEAWTLCRTRPGLSHAELVQRLADRRDAWLDSPLDDGSSMMTNSEIIELERRRIPMVDNHVVDDDCPICQAQAQGAFGPAFLWFDGHHLELEDEFAFSLLESRDEWEGHQESYRELEKQWQMQDRKPRSEPSSDKSDEEKDGEDELGTVWQSSYVDWEKLEGDSGGTLSHKLAIGFPLAELVSDLKALPDSAERVRAINAAYVNFSRAQDTVTSRSAAQQLRDLLEDAAHAFPQLTSKSADLQSRLDEALRTSKV